MAKQTPKERNFEMALHAKDIKPCFRCFTKNRLRLTLFGLLLLPFYVICGVLLGMNRCILGIIEVLLEWKSFMLLEGIGYWHPKG